MLPKIQHYVPRFILRNFCFNEEEQIYVFDKKTEKVFQTNIKNVAAESGFYNFKDNNIKFSIERNLNNLETTVAEIIKKIIEQESLSNITKDERIKLSVFIAAQFFRVKQKRIIMKQVYEAVLDHIKKTGGDPNRIPGIISNDEELNKLDIASLIDVIVESTPVFYDKTWMLFKSTKAQKFYISDNPITLQNHNDFSPYGNLGLKFRGIEIYFPISSGLSLGIFESSMEDTIRWSHSYLKDKKTTDLKVFGIDKKTIQDLKKLTDGLETGKSIQAEDGNVVNLNSLQVAFSARYVFSSNQDFDLVQKMLKKNPKLKEPPKMVISHSN